MKQSDHIALNYSDVYALADGLTYSRQRDFLQALPLYATGLSPAKRPWAGWKHAQPLR